MLNIPDSNKKKLNKGNETNKLQDDSEIHLL